MNQRVNLLVAILAALGLVFVLAVAATAPPPPALPSQAASAQNSAVAAPAGHITFAASIEGSRDVFTLRSDGTALQNITRSAAAETAPTWAPDGSQLAVLADRGGRLTALVLAADGSGRRRVIREPMQMYALAWSPDGAYLAFSGGELANNTPQNYGIYIVKPDGSERRRIGDIPSRTLAWSPDGTLLAYAAVDEPGIYVIPTAGGAPTKISDDRVSDISWSPDGTQLALATTRVLGGRAEPLGLVTIRRDGTQRRPIAGPGAFAPAWSPDGSWLAYGAPAAGHVAVWARPLVGSGDTQLSDAFDELCCLSWQP